jgi:putative molybdopterin biosynthesis protein
MRLTAAMRPASPEHTATPDTTPELHGVSPAAALGAWLEGLRGTGRFAARLETTTVPVTQALGRVTADPVWALRSSPAFPAAAMDGIAVRAGDTSRATPARPVRLVAGTFDVVDTGNPLPADRDAVVMREHVRLELGAATIEAPAAAGAHVRPAGEDVAAGELLFAPGHRLRAVDLAAAAAAGVTELTVRRPATVAILPTGDELRPAGTRLADGEIADTNSLMLDGQAREAGCETLRWPILPDDPDTLAAALRAAADQADLVILVAGTSAGRKDHAPDVLRRCGLILVRGVAMRPGHPVVLGVVDGTPVMACPGYPVSAALAFDELALPLLASIDRAAAARRPTAPAQLAAGVRSKRGAVERVRVRFGTVDGRPVAVPLRRGASVLTSLARADGLLAIPPEYETVRAGTAVRPELLRPGAPLDLAVLVAGAPDRALDLLALAVAGGPAGERGARVAFCEMPSDDALALVGDGLCHAAAVAGRASVPPVDAGAGGHRVVRLAECDVAIAVAPGARPPARPCELLDGGGRFLAGPRGTPARHVLDETLDAIGADASAITEVRSDAAAVAAVAGGHADGAVITLPAARRAGLATLPLGRAALDLVIHRDVAGRDPAVRALLDALQSAWLRSTLELDGYDTGGPMMISNHEDLR